MSNLPQSLLDLHTCFLTPAFLAESHSNARSKNTSPASRTSNVLIAEAWRLACIATSKLRQQTTFSNGKKSHSLFKTDFVSNIYVTRMAVRSPIRPRWLRPGNSFYATQSPNSRNDESEEILTLGFQVGTTLARRSSGKSGRNQFLGSLQPSKNLDFLVVPLLHKYFPAGHLARDSKSR